MKLIFATHNPHKVQEIQSLCPANIQIHSLKDLGYKQSIPETMNTIEGNSLQKAQHVFDVFGQSCFSEDTGLEVDALNGNPGVNTAGYAGENATFDDNINKLLAEMNGSDNRAARFVTVITLLDEAGKPHQFRGVCVGTILEQKKGSGGFGYDPVFLPAGSNKSFAEMSIEEKNFFSHRAKAFAKFVSFLNEKV